jgi:hypothetical protein
MPIDPKELAILARISAIELLLTEMLAKRFLRTADPEAAASGYRIGLKQIAATSPLPAGIEPGAAALVSGAVEDALDGLAGAAERLVRKKVRLSKRRPQ